MTKTFPTIFSYSQENLDNKYQYFLDKEYTMSEIIKMTKSLPTIFGLNQENLDNKYQYFLDKGYTMPEVIKMTKTLPTIFGYSQENLEEKITFYNENRLHFIITEDTLYLMQSVDLSYARYQYFLDKNIFITKDNYRLLFYGNKSFIKRFGISKEELLSLYPYPREESQKKEK